MPKYRNLLVANVARSGFDIIFDTSHISMGNLATVTTYFLDLQYVRSSFLAPKGEGLFTFIDFRNDYAGRYPAFIGYTITHTKARELYKCKIQPCSSFIVHKSVCNRRYVYSAALYVSHQSRYVNISFETPFTTVYRVTKHSLFWTYDTVSRSIQDYDLFHLCFSFSPSRLLLALLSLSFFQRRQCHAIPSSKFVISFDAFSVFRDVGHR